MVRCMKAVARRRAVAVLMLAAALVVAAPAVAGAAGYRQRNLVSDIPGKAMLTDSNLVNPWGLSAGPQTPLWVADNGTGVSTIYPGAVNGSPLTIAPLVVTIPQGAPTGTVYNPTQAFKVPISGGMAPATFLFDSEAGTVSAWPFTNPPMTSATQVAMVHDAIFKGLTLGHVRGMGPLLYAADFHNNQVVVFNGRFQRVNMMGAFMDRRLPAHYAPFGIQNIDGWIYVSYAKQDAQAMDELHGPGLGFVDVYTRSGHLVKRLASRGPLNAPWGLVRAPAGFGRFSHAILVGNFGDGRIHAYSDSGHLLGTLRRPTGRPIAINGLWGLRFGNGVTGERNTLLFSAGIDDEAHGLLGTIRASH
jgi:uncharacterized protein (TIGR03118 family)